SNDLHMAIQINPTNSQTYLIRGVLEQKSGNFASALADFKRGLLNDTEAVNVPDVYEAIGYAHAELAQWRPALEDFHKAMAFNSPPTDVPFQIFLIEYRLGAAQQARKDLGAYIRSIPAAKSHDWTASIAHFLAGTLNENDLINQARSKAKRPTDVATQTGDAWYYAGMLHWLAGDKSGAFERFKKSLKLGDDNSDNYLMARSMLGDSPSAANPQPSAQRQADSGK
ncbi:MAG: tetratricopeptide repeat protein, partial [Limisphaerales bacterium]